jgi:hypothetical protein
MTGPEVGTFVGMSYSQHAQQLSLSPAKELLFAVDPWNIGMGFDVEANSQPHPSMEQVVYEDEDGLVVLNRWCVKTKVELKNVRYQPSPF